MKTITNEPEFDTAVARMEELWGSEIGTPEGNELDELLDAIWDYQEKHHRFQGQKRCKP